MGSQMQKFLDKEKILVESNKFKQYQKDFETQIREADNEKLRQYFLEYSESQEDGKLLQGAFEFMQWIIANK